MGAANLVISVTDYNQNSVASKNIHQRGFKNFKPQFKLLLTLKSLN